MRWLERGLQSVEFPGEGEVLFRQAAGIVRGENERHLVPADINVGMMPGFLRELGDGGDELDGRRKIFEDERPRDGFAALAPIGNSRERGLDLGGIQFGHDIFMPKPGRWVTPKGAKSAS